MEQKKYFLIVITYARILKNEGKTIPINILNSLYK